MKQLTILFIVLQLLTIGAWAQQKSTVREYEQTFTTYPFSDPNPNPVFSRIYPYYRYDGFTNQPIQKKWKVVELENDYIRVLILPEIGGKIWTAIEKSTGKPFIYYNHVVKFRDIAMRGPWTSGGLEANYGIIGHTPNCATPVDYTTKTNPDGSVSCTIGALDLLTRSYWRMEIQLPADKAYFTTQSFWYGNDPLRQPYYHWMNTGLKSAGNLEFIYPGNRYLGHNGEYSEWPMHPTNGKNLSFYENNNFGGYKSYHVFGKYTRFFGGYWHDENFGMARVSEHADKAGKKIWIWGLSQQGMIWERLLTDTDGQYVEVQSGRLFNQNAEASTFTPFKHLSFAPYTTDLWKEYWYPVKGTNGMVEASEWAALNVTKTKKGIVMKLSPVASVQDVLEVRNGQQVVYQRNISLKPLQNFTDSLTFEGNTEHLSVSLGQHKLNYSLSPEAGELARPVETPTSFDWESPYGLSVQGHEFMYQRMYPEAEEKFLASFRKDANHLPTLIGLSELLYHRMLYDEALVYARRGLRVNSHDGQANYIYGLVQDALGNTIDAKDGFDLASLSPDTRSAAYTELSRIYLREKDYVRAIQYANRATDFNRYNMAALRWKSAALRKSGDNQISMTVTNQMLELDPISHAAHAETYLRERNDMNRSRLATTIRQDLATEAWLELIATYSRAGLLEDALAIAECAPTHIMISYWKSWLTYRLGNNPRAALQSAAAESVLLTFPFRNEEATVLSWVIEQSPNDWKAHYLLAMLMRDRQRSDESRKLISGLPGNTGFAPLHAFTAMLERDQHPEKFVTELQVALALAPEEWRHVKMLTEHWLSQGKNEEALAVVSDWHRRHPKNYIIGMLHARCLLRNGQYAEADQLLSQTNIIPFEGATEGRELYREAKLMQAAKLIKAKKMSAAAKFIATARVWPSQLGVGKPYERDVDERLEDWMDYLLATASKNKKESDRLLNRIRSFTPGIENTVSNFIDGNHLVSAWAIEKTENREAALEWLRDQLAAYPRPGVKWASDSFAGRLQVAPSGADASIRILIELSGK